MPLVLTGATSGSTTLQSTDAVTAVLTLPSTTGTLLTTTGDGSGLTGIPAPAALSTASGSAPSYSARAWVNFNGTGTVAIRDSGNVSSITDNSTGNYTVNFTTAMSDANYAVADSISGSPLSDAIGGAYTYSAGSFLINTRNGVNAQADRTTISVVVFR